MQTSQYGIRKENKRTYGFGESFSDIFNLHRGHATLLLTI
jgi:hypothetical protein